MGALILPPEGPVYLDANCFIYSVEKVEPYCTLLLPVWKAACSGRFTIVSSELVVPETLVKPIRDRDTTVENAFRALFTAVEVRLIPITSLILDASAQIRANDNLKLPDAIHAASALAEGCTLFLTNDAGFRRVSRLPVAILTEALVTP